VGENLSREERENLHKWGKARRMIDERKVSVVSGSDERYQFRVTGDTETYTVGIDIDTGESFCPCSFRGELCSHQLAAHLHLAGIGVENERYRIPRGEG
jgi:hypothetical protein